MPVEHQSTDQGLPDKDDGPVERINLKVYRHIPDFEKLDKQVAVRLCLILRMESPPYLYVNPICSIICDRPAPEFFELARQFQGQWCRRSQQTITRRRTRRAREWVSLSPWSNEPKRKQKYYRYLERSLVFTGVLFIDGRHIPAGQWPIT